MVAEVAAPTWVAVTTAAVALTLLAAAAAGVPRMPPRVGVVGTEPDARTLEDDGGSGARACVSKKTSEKHKRTNNAQVGILYSITMGARRLFFKED